MKKIYLIIISAFLCISYSCSDMLDNIQDYLDEGETIYVGKLDSLKAFPGKNRIKIEGQMIYGVNQVKCVISWRDPITLEVDSREFPIIRENPRETFDFMLDNLNEGQHDFSIVTYDPKGNESIPTEISAYAYGEQYQEILNNRIIRSITPQQITDENNNVVWVAIIDWNISRGDGIIGCNIDYEQEDGTFKTIYVPVDDNVTTLYDFKAGGVLHYNTEYLPEELSIDFFTTEKDDFILPEKNYVGVTKDLTSIYIKNAGHPFTGYDMEGNWGKLHNWSWNDAIRNQNGAGGAGFATYGGGIVQFESTRWDQGTFANGKVWQTINLPKGKYEIRIEVGNAANQGAGGHTFRFAVVEGTSLPDNAALDSPDSSVLSSFQFFENNRTETIPSFELDSSTQVTIGWVVSFTETHRNIEFKSVRLWSLAE
ncbi:MAG: DUF4998 domain-containing protein [Dysgonomonas sp.]|nr:DUF4998 domain-containing protein [Dysgonomonas sp.]